MTIATFSTSVECPVDNLRPRTGFGLKTVFLTPKTPISPQFSPKTERVRP